MFLASRILLLILVLIATLASVELFVQGAATVGAAFSQHGASLSDFQKLAGSALMAVLILIGIKYVFRPPAIRARYWTVFAMLALSTAIAAYVVLR